MLPTISGSTFSYPFNPTPERVFQLLRKRKRQELVTPEHDEADEDYQAEKVVFEAEENSNAARASLPGNLAKQYQLAGLAYDQDLPSGDFPHRAQHLRLQPLTPKQIQNEVSSLKPPLFIPLLQTQDRAHTSLRQRHILNLTAILHKFILRGDYARAERAWSMLLRMKVSGCQLDLRSSGLWGFGAELLLRREACLAAERQGFERPCSSDGNSEIDDSQSEYLTEKGVEKAKAYYERLILHFPYRRWLPQSMSALHFYPVLFTFRIALLHEQYQIRTVGKSNDSDAETEEGEESEGRTELIRRDVLGKAVGIADSVDAIAQTPPYSDDPVLLRLRGMLALWIGDLSVILRDKQQSAQDERQAVGSDDNEARRQTMLIESAYATSMHARSVQVELANRCFERAGIDIVVDY